MSLKLIWNIHQGKGVKLAWILKIVIRFGARPKCRQKITFIMYRMGSGSFELTPLVKAIILYLD